jgi:hypothetical protein
MAADQRYCLECGERSTPMSSVLLGGPPARDDRPATTPPARTGPPADGAWQRGNTLTVIAGVGVLLLAMGVGVLIGRSGSSKVAAAPPQVISVASTPAAGTGAAPAAEASFNDDWPSGTSGFTVQLQTLPQTTTVGALQAAKAAAATKGAKGVGALKSEDFSSLAAGHYVIYAGVFHKRSEAASALSSLKNRFAGASVIAVSNRASRGGGGTGSAGGSGGVGSSLSKPAPPSVLPSSQKKGKSYEQESKNLPNVISTG